MSSIKIRELLQLQVATPDRMFDKLKENALNTRLLLQILRSGNDKPPGRFRQPTARHILVEHDRLEIGTLQWNFFLQGQDCWNRHVRSSARYHHGCSETYGGVDD